MSDKTSKKRRRIREIYWLCDKKGCNTGNRRSLLDDIVLNDDVCDYCHNRIHEPVLIDLKNDQ